MSKYNTLGERIKNARQKMGLNQTELADKLNCTQAALSQYEKGVREPGLSDLTNIANKLNTTTDYLLGRTDVLSDDISIKNIGDYLGLTDESIKCLNEMYVDKKRNTDEAFILKEVKAFDGSIPGDDGFGIAYDYVKGYHQQDLEDYVNTLNKFICSYEFTVLLSKLMDNIFLERTVYDILRVVVKQYDKIESPLLREDLAAQAYALVEESDDHIKRYLLNMFEIQNTIMDFSQNFTRLEEIKRLEHKDRFFWNVAAYLYLATSDMFKNDKYSTEEMEKELEYAREKYGVQIQELLKEV